MASPAVAAVLICSSILIFRHFFSKNAANHSEREEFRPGDIRVSWPELCCQLVKGELTQGTMRNRLPFCQSRAEPNQRLRHVFGIENAFTTCDDDTAKEFVDDARKRINLTPSEWSDLSDVLVETARRWIFVGFEHDGQETDLNKPNCDGKSFSARINITKLVQGLTVVSILKTVCKAEANAHPADSDIINLAQEIHRGWIKSKQLAQINGKYDDMLKFENNKDLQASLRAVFMEPGQEKGNPLNAVIPAFETTWRVVLRILLEVKFRSAHEHPEWCNALFQFCSESTKAQFEMRSVSRLDLTTTGMVGSERESIETPSARDIVKEGLRLYTPTRRIHRAYLWEDYPFSDGTGGINATGEVSLGSSGQSPSYEAIAANIEACHMRPEIWGSSSRIFDPLRWINLTTERTGGFIPFGCGPHECPAKSVFAPRMVGLLVGALIVVLEKETSGTSIKWALECSNDEVMGSLFSKERLSTERDAFDDLELVGSNR